jgi:lysophospholipase L1-like esterase
MAYSRYVAIGDSTTEGLEDPYPDGSGYRGWAERLAQRLAVENPELRYANLAVRGKLARQVREEQLETALALKPDISTVVAGLNDTLRRHCDMDTVTGHLDVMIGALRGTGATVVTMAFPDPAPVNALARHARPRLFAYNRRVREIAARHGALVVDFERDGAPADRRLWHPDRLHANPEGHARIAEALAETLGLPGAGREWTQPLPPAEVVPRRQALADDLRWARVHLAPWLLRRARGVSSGDGRVAKRPRLEAIQPE